MQNYNTNTEINDLIEQAVSGNGKALEELLAEVQDMIFNLALRMLGTVPDAEDATQEILIRIITNLMTFRRECAFKTWVYRLSVNYLLNYKKSMFAAHPLDFEFYGNDIRYAKLDEEDRILDEMTRKKLAEELKMSCSNVMLQCLDVENRCIFILGTMFCVDSRSGAEIMEITPENYRQRLSRARKKVAEFLTEYCGLSGRGFCSCYHRVSYAVSQGRLSTEHMEFAELQTIEKEKLFECTQQMEKLDALACTFEKFPCYRSTVSGEQIVRQLLDSEAWKKIQTL